MKRGPHEPLPHAERLLRIKNAHNRTKQERLDARAAQMRKDNDEKNVKRRPRKKELDL